MMIGYASAANYKDKNTGVIYTLEKLKVIWEQFGDEDRHESFEDMLSDMEETFESAE